MMGELTVFFLHSGYIKVQKLEEIAFSAFIVQVQIVKTIGMQSLCGVHPSIKQGKS